MYIGYYMPWDLIFIKQMSMYDMLIKWDFGEHNLSRTTNIKS